MVRNSEGFSRSLYLDQGTSLDDFLQLIVKDQNKATAHAPEDVGPGALVEGFAPLILEDLLPAMDSPPVHDLGSFEPRLHHHPPPHGIKGVGDQARHGRHHLCDGPIHCDVGVLGVREHAFGRVVQAEVGSPIEDDALHGDAEALVQATDAVRLGDLHQTVSQAFELPLRVRFPHVSSQTGSGEIQGVDEAKRGGSSRPTGGQVASKISPELRALVHAPQEDLLVLVLEGKVKGLRGEVVDDVGQVAPPERQHTLFLGDAQDAVHDALVLLVHCDLLTGMLHLQQQLDPLNRGHGRFGDGGCDASSQEVLGEGNDLFHHGGAAGRTAGSGLSGGAGSWKVGAAASALQLPGPEFNQLY